MKRTAIKPAPYDSGPNMTPLVDVVMVILIFLMLAGSFGAASHLLPHHLPLGSHGSTRVPLLPDPQLQIFLSSKSDGLFQARLDNGDIYTDAPSLVQALQAKRLQHESTGQPADKIQLLIAPTRNTQWNHVAQVYQAAMHAEWPKISFEAARE